MTCSLQSWDWLKNWGNKDNEVSKWIWKAVDAETRKITVAKTKKETKEIKEQEKAEERRDNRKKLVLEPFHKWIKVFGEKWVRECWQERCETIQ